MVTYLISQIVVVDGNLFSIVEDTAFHMLLRDPYSWCMATACTTLSRTMLPSLYRAARDHVKVQLSCACRRTVHFMSDTWTSAQVHNTYLLLTVNWW